MVYERDICDCFSSLSLKWKLVLRVGNRARLTIERMKNICSDIETDVASYANITNTDDSVVWYEW